jgi:enoyl-CoA hydratase/carnithine racemase
MSYPDYSAQGWQNIVVSLDGPVAIVKLNRAKEYAPTSFHPTNCLLQAEFPYRRNTFTALVERDLVAAYELLDRDDRVRVIVLTADHTAYAFCSGVRPAKPYF